MHRLIITLFYIKLTLTAKNIFLSSIFLLFTTFAFAQEKPPKHQISINYFGETYTHPGTSIIYHYNVHQKEKNSKKGTLKKHFIQYQLSNRIAFYVHPKNHNGLLVNSGIYLQKKKENGFLMGIGLEAGCQMKWLNEDTYQFNNGVIERVRWSRQSHFIMGIGARIGKDFYSKKINNHLGWRMSSAILLSSPFRVTRQLVSFLELGCSYSLTPKK